MCDEEPLFRPWVEDGRGALRRFDPKTGKAREWPSPGGSESGPCGIATVNNIVWYSEAGTLPNTLVRFDPKTKTFQSWAIPSGGGIVRNMMPTRDETSCWPAAVSIAWP
jgi:virginiamycin B lyase